MGQDNYWGRAPTCSRQKLASPKSHPRPQINERDLGPAGCAHQGYLRGRTGLGRQVQKLRKQHLLLF